MLESHNFSFYPTTALSTSGEAGQQIYTRSSVIGAATTNDPDILSTPPLIFTRVKKCNFGLIADQSSRCGLETEQDISTIFKLGVYRRPEMFPPNLVQIGPRVFKKAYSGIGAPPINGRKICR